jgi:hypothetical protein
MSEKERDEKLHRMSHAGVVKVKKREELSAAAKAAQEEEEVKKHSFAPKTNIVTKRKLEEKKAKEKQKQASGRKKTLHHLTDGGWIGEMPLPNSYDKPSTCKVLFAVTNEDPDGESQGWMRFMPEGELGGPDGMVVKWSAWASPSTPKNPSSPRSKDLENESVMWDMDITFPPSISATPIPCLLRFSPNGQIVEIGLPVGDNKSDPIAVNPSGFFGSKYPVIDRPRKLEWPNAVITLNLVEVEELEPPPKKELVLGTSLKNVTMSVLKEIKKLCKATLVTPQGTPLNETEQPIDVCIKFWHIKLKFKLYVDSFWTIMKLRVGIARIYNNFPFLMPGGKIADPVYLAQACEDEKDGRLQDLLDETIGELVDLCEACELECEDMGTHTIRHGDDDDVTWFMGYHTFTSDPISVYLACPPTRLARIRLLNNRLNDPRPFRVCDLASGSGLELYSENSGGGGQDGDGDENAEPQAVKGTRGKLIMQAERNKKALEDGTYGKSNSAFEAGAGVLGRGQVTQRAPPSATVVDIRLMKLKSANGKSLADANVSVEEKEAIAIMERRAERLRAGGDPQLLDTMRKARMKYQNVTLEAAKSESMALGQNKSFSEGKRKVDTVEAARIAKLKSMTIEARTHHVELYHKAQLAATRKRTRPEEIEADIKKESELLHGHAVVRSPDEIRRTWERMIASRQRKLMDFLPGGSKAGMSESANENAKAVAARQEAPLGGFGGGNSNKPAMTEEEKEMLAILKGINTSDSSKFASGNNEPSSGSVEKISGPKKKIRDSSKTSEIAAMRLEVLLQKKNETKK